VLTFGIFELGLCIHARCSPVVGTVSFSSSAYWDLYACCWSSSFPVARILSLSHLKVSLGLLMFFSWWKPDGRRQASCHSFTAYNHGCIFFLLRAHSFAHLRLSFPHFCRHLPSLCFVDVVISPVSRYVTMFMTYLSTSHLFRSSSSCISGKFPIVVPTDFCPSAGHSLPGYWFSVPQSPAVSRLVIGRPLCLLLQAVNIVITAILSIPLGDGNRSLTRQTDRP